MEITQILSKPRLYSECDNTYYKTNQHQNDVVSFIFDDAKLATYMITTHNVYGQSEDALLLVEINPRKEQNNNMVFIFQSVMSLKRCCIYENDIITIDGETMKVSNLIVMKGNIDTLISLGRI